MAFLRQALVNHLKGSDPGEQSRIADRIACPGGTLSKFKHGSHLPAEYIEPLARAMTA